MIMVTAAELYRTFDAADFFELLDSGAKSQTRVVIDCIHGGYGEHCAMTAAKALSEGVGFGGDFDIVLPFGDYLLMQGHLDQLIAIVEAGPAEAVLRAWGLPGNSRLTKVQWLDLLCTTVHPDRPAKQKSFLSYATWRSRCSSSVDLRFNSLRAIEYVWNINQDHADFATIAAEQSEEGDVIRAFLAYKQCIRGDRIKIEKAIDELREIVARSAP